MSGQCHFSARFRKFTKLLSSVCGMFISFHTQTQNSFVVSAPFHLHCPLAHIDRVCAKCLETKALLTSVPFWSLMLSYPLFFYSGMLLLLYANNVVWAQSTQLCIGSDYSETHVSLSSCCVTRSVHPEWNSKENWPMCNIRSVPQSSDILLIRRLDFRSDPMKTPEFWAFRLNPASLQTLQLQRGFL